MVRRVLWTTPFVLAAGCGLFVDLNGLSERDGPADAAVAEAGPAEASSLVGGDGGADAGSPYRAAVLADHPVSYWPLDEAAGSLVAKDVVGGRDATLTGKSTFGVPGVSGSALLVTNRDARLEVGDVYSLAGRAPYSIEIWAQPKLNDPFANVGARRSEQLEGWVLYFRDNGAAQFEQRWPTGQRVAFSTAAQTYASPVQLVVTFDGAKLAMYLDGEKVPATFADPGDATSVPVPFAWAPGYEGLLDELAIYDHALPPDRVLAHRAAGIR